MSWFGRVRSVVGRLVRWLVSPSGEEGVRGAADHMQRAAKALRRLDEVSAAGTSEAAEGVTPGRAHRTPEVVSNEPAWTRYVPAPWRAHVAKGLEFADGPLSWLSGRLRTLHSTSAAGVAVGLLAVLGLA